MLLEFLLAGLVGLTLAIAGLLVVEHRRRVHPALAQRVLVNLDDGAVRGFLITQYGDWLVLQQADWLEADGKRTPFDGDLVIERRRVQFLQLLPTT